MKQRPHNKINNTYKYRLHVVVEFALFKEGFPTGWTDMTSDTIMTFTVLHVISLLIKHLMADLTLHFLVILMDHTMSL